MAYPPNTVPDIGDTEQLTEVKILAILNGAVTGTTPLAVNTDGAGGTVRTPSIATVSTSGTVAAGAKSIDFIFSSDFAGTVLGATFTGGPTLDRAYSLTAPTGDTLAAVAYTVSAGSIRISKVV